MLYSNIEANVDEIYKRYGINTVACLNVDNLSKSFGIKLCHSPDLTGGVRTKSGLGIIILNKTLSELELRKAFFHEFGHLIMQVARQDESKPIQAEYLEDVADRFAYNASMPRHMVKEVMRQCYKKDAIKAVASEFIVSYADADKRVQQIHRDKLYMMGVR